MQLKNQIFYFIDVVNVNLNSHTSTMLDIDVCNSIFQAQLVSRITSSEFWWKYETSLLQVIIQT